MLSEIVSESYLMGIAFLAAVALAVILLPLSGLLAKSLGAIDHPDERKIHEKSISRMGGLAMALSLAIVLIIALGLENETVRAFLLGGGFVVFTGLMDDTRGISHRMKFLGETLAALAFVVAGGFYLQSFGNLLGFGEITTGPAWLGTIITVFCMVGVMNAVNLADGLDGLAAGLCLIAALFMALAGYESGAVVWTSITLALAGVMLGFLRHNHYPAKLFMGDTGSLLLGYSMAAVAVGLARTDAGYRAIEPVMLGTLLALPIVDTLWVMGNRKLTGRHPFKPDQKHFHHRLHRLGLRHNETVAVLYIVMFALGCYAWFGRGLPEWIRFYSVIAFFAILYSALHVLEYHNVSLRTRLISFRLKHRRGSRSPGSGSPAWLDGGAGVLLVALLVTPMAAINPLPEYMGMPLLGTALFGGLLYPWQGNRTRRLAGFGIIYAACFMVFFTYMIVPDKPLWVMPVVYGTVGLALLGLLGCIRMHPSNSIVLPTGFELLLFFASWLVPLIVLPIAGADIHMQFSAAVSCVLALVITLLFKQLLRRRPLPNIAVAASFIFALLLLGIAAFS